MVNRALFINDLVIRYEQQKRLEKLNKKIEKKYAEGYKSSSDSDDSEASSLVIK